MCFPVPCSAQADTQAAGQAAAAGGAHAAARVQILRLRTQQLKPLERRPFTVCADGNMKHNHHANCGRTITAVYQRRQWQPVQPLRFFGHRFNNPEAWEQYKTRRQAAHQSDDQGEVTCAAHISAARATPTSGGAKEVDWRCIIGTCCHHGVPLLEHFIACMTHENFSYYDHLVASLIHLLGPELAALVLDFNCKYAKLARGRLLGLEGGLAADPGQAAAPGQAADPGQADAWHLRFFIGWLHSNSGHKLSCQLGYSSMYAASFGRLVGEAMEQLWVGACCGCGCMGRRGEGGHMCVYLPTCCPA
jgi:hypothetical protein